MKLSRSNMRSRDGSFQLHLPTRMRAAACSVIGQGRSSLQRAVVAQERVRLAGDLHDSTMQAITAAALQLKQIAETEHEPAIRARLDQVQAQLVRQQREIRSFITM